MRARGSFGMLVRMGNPSTVVLTGGGTAGHVTPNLALVPELRSRGYAVEYVGSAEGMERELCTRAGLPYHVVSVGKLRRYASWENLTDPFRTLSGIAQAARLLRRLRAVAVFSKGGFVAVPVVAGAWLNRIPAIVHESDLSPGLANRLCFPLARRICVTYEETLARIPGRDRARVTGTPIRPELLAGSRERGFERFALSSKRPVVLVFGGSSGARALNDALRELLRSDGTDLQFLHVCGRGNIDQTLENRPDYRQFEYLNEEFPDALACADAVVARGGANSLCELVALRKPAVVVPLPTAASRGDQLENAARFAAHGYGIALSQEELGAVRLQAEIEALLAGSDRYIAAMERDAPADAARVISDLIEELVRR